MKEDSLWHRIVEQVFKKNLSLTLIIIAALLLELTTAVMYYSAQDIIYATKTRLVKQEMNSAAMSIRKQLAKVEATINNYAWVVSGDVEKSEWLFETSRQLLDHNPFLLGCGVAFRPDFYPKKGRWFEPYAVRRPDGHIESMQLGSMHHDYSQKEFYAFTLENDSDHWSEPYIDMEGAQMVVTTYSSPVHGLQDSSIIAVVFADISLEWLKDLMDYADGYASTQRFLISRNYALLAGEEDSLYHAILHQIKEDKSGQGYFTMENEKEGKQHVFYYPVGGITGWQLICVCSDEEVFGTLRHVRRTLLSLVLAGLMLIGFIVWRTSRNLERLHEVNAEQERIGGELRVASRIQQTMLPRSHLQDDDVELCGCLVPARAVGGDLYDYFTRDGKLFFCIGDVSGKGPAAAMLMGVTHALFRAFSSHQQNPDKIMKAMNEASCQGNDSNMFVTLFIGVLDLPTGRLRYCDAGHDAPIVVGTGALECNPHLPIGVFDGVNYTMQETVLEEGATLFLYTDGVTEAKNEARQLFGLERTEAVLQRCAAAQLGPKEILEAMGDEVRRFVGSAEQSDDLTMLAIRYTPRHFESRLTEALMLKNDVHDVVKLSAFMKSVIEQLEIEPTLANQLRLAVEEAVVNVMDYAYAIGIEGYIEVRALSDGQSLKVVIIDNGVPFDPTAKDKADITLSAEERQIGGLGILLVRDLMDSINYERIEGKNILTLIKRIK